MTYQIVAGTAASALRSHRWGCHISGDLAPANSIDEDTDLVGRDELRLAAVDDAVFEQCGIERDNELVPKLRGKIHVAVGTADQWHLD